MRKDYKILVEYPPELPIRLREEVDRQQVQRLQDEHPQGKPVEMKRRLLSEYRAHLYVTMEWK